MNNFHKSLAKYGVYFEELRIKLLFLTKIFAVCFIIGFFITTPVIRFILAHLNIPDISIVTTSPFQLIEFAMSVGFFFACVVTLPIFIYHLYSFLKPGLLKSERKVFILSLPFGLGLFVFGFLYGGGMLYYGIKLMAKVNAEIGIANYWDISKFVSQIVLTASLLGLLFTFPLVLTFLIRLGILSADFLRSKRRHAFAGVFVLVALLPPTDGLSLILMAVPLILLFELTVFFNRKNNSGRNLVT